MTKLPELMEHGLLHWKLEVYTPGQNFVEIAKCFVKARGASRSSGPSHLIKLSIGCSVDSPIASPRIVFGHWIW